MENNENTVNQATETPKKGFFKSSFDDMSANAKAVSGMNKACMRFIKAENKKLCALAKNASAHLKEASKFMTELSQEINESI